MTRRAVVWLSRKLDKPVLKLVDEEYNESGVGELLTAHGPAYNVNIRVFNQLQRTITGWPGGKPEADDSNRPERSEPYPKRVLVFSPEPSDAVASMGGTLDRLIMPGSRVLDIGCAATGRSAAVLDDLGADVFALDIDPLAVRELSEDGISDTWHLAVADMCRLPFQPGGFAGAVIAFPGVD